MKPLKILIVALLCGVAMQAQEQGTFRGNATIGYAIPAEGGGGILWSFEPQYNIKDNMNVGIRFNYAALVKDIKFNSETYESPDVAAVSTYMATYNYYFNDGSSTFAPFVGLGMGMATVAAANFNVGGTVYDVKSETKFGGMIRGGFEWSKFLFCLEYDMISKSEYDQVTSAGGSAPLNSKAVSKNSYFGISIGFFVGGNKWGNSN